MPEARTAHDNRDDHDHDDHDHDDHDHAGGEADYYAVLGVAPDASHEVIHQAYRRLAMLWHPDRYTLAPPELRARAERRMRSISRAWGELGDPLHRRDYDRRRFGQFTALDVPVEHQHVTHDAHLGNGAGIFAGMLCVILALPLLINLLNGSIHHQWEILVVAIVVIGLFALAGLFFTTNSPLAHLATNWSEGEPRGFHDQPTQSPDVSGEYSAGGANETASDKQPDESAQSLNFDVLVEEALAIIPDDFKSFMENVLVRVKGEPTAEELRQLEVGPGGILFGLYTGVPLTAQGAHAAGPEMVTIYRGPIERYCQGDPERIREQVRRTVLHEVAHHFGIDHDQMPDWLK